MAPNGLLKAQNFIRTATGEATRVIEDYGWVVLGLTLASYFLYNNILKPFLLKLSHDRALR
jgi:hypothetical protein